MFFKRKPEAKWSKVFARIQREFPEVRQITCDQLAGWLGRPAEECPVLIDVRDADEFAVSHLPGARHVPPKSDPAELLQDVDQNRFIVAYCAAGVRSSRMARKAMAAGFSNVANLQGAIFKWANEGHPIVLDGKPASKVHACDRRWSELLKPELRVLPG